MYRYDHFFKRHPLSEPELTKPFLDDHDLVMAKRYHRRNAVVHRNGLIEIFQGPYHSDHSHHHPHHPYLHPPPVPVEESLH